MTSSCRTASRSYPAAAVAAVVLLVFLAGLSFLGAACGDKMGRVQLDSGTVAGAKAGDLQVFKGIPYAAPPVGELRWQDPQPVTPWEGVRQCIEAGPACPQSSEAWLPTLSVGEMSEDCLYLDVWTPAERPDDSLPVMVWIHGGSFESGSGSMAIYDGANLAAQGVVVVSINYRVGPLGFLAHPALSAESAHGSSGNYGLLDQIAALEWVKANIAGFGGDPGNVTVFGESAGAISILGLLVSPLAEGLFHKAIAQSGILLDRGFGFTTAATLGEAEETGVDLAERLGVDDTAAAAAAAAQLRAKTPEELLAAAGDSGNVFESGLAWRPVADGYLLPDLPSVLWAEGRRHPIPLLIGSNSDEGELFVQGLSADESMFEELMGQVFGSHRDEAVALYPVGDPAEVVPALSRMLTEIGFASTARLAARSMSTPAAGISGPAGSTDQAAPVYLYQFTRVPFGNPMGAFHAVEIPYVFGNIEQFAFMGGIEQVDQDLSAAMMGYWTRFAATGDPNGEGAPVWPSYDATGDRHLELGDVIREASGLYEEACDLAEKVRGL